MEFFITAILLAILYSIVFKYVEYSLFQIILTAVLSGIIFGLMHLFRKWRISRKKKL